MAESELENDVFELKLLKTKCKTAFTKTRNKLMTAVSDAEEINKSEVRTLQDSFDKCQDDLSSVLEKLCIAYKRCKDADGVKKVQSEMDTMNADYSMTHEHVQKVFETLKSTSDLCETEKQLGTDMWRQMKRVQIPTFNGDKRKYNSWKSAFEACIDKAPATPEYKLLQLRQYLTGEALRAIENLGHSAASYEAAKERLDRKYGGSRRQVALYLEELDRYPQMKEENSQNIEKFADLIDIAVINLKEAGREEDLGNGALYISLQKKMPETMLTRYHRWLFETDEEESVETLRQWMIQEVKYHTIACETVRGLTNSKNSKNRTFFGENNERKSMCKVCGEDHKVWQCDTFKSLSVKEKWAKAKELQLCFRCLQSDHRGNKCKNTRTCNVNGCTKTHNRLLHSDENRTSRKPTTLNGHAAEFIPRANQAEHQVFTNS